MMEFAVKVVPNGDKDRAQKLTLTNFQFWQSIPTFIGTATNVSHYHQLTIPNASQPHGIKKSQTEAANESKAQIDMVSENNTFLKLNLWLLRVKILASPKP